jgi:hypothetical protein
VNKCMSIILVLLALLFWSCAGRESLGCAAATISRAEIIKVVQDEIRKKGGDPSSTERSKIKIKREGCDYIYYQVYRPRRPGGYLFVRIDEHGQITDWVPGL